MPFLLYDYVSANGVNEFQLWTARLETIQIAQLNQKLDKVATHGDGMPPDTLTDSAVPGIKKLRIRVGGVQLRPMLTKGPLHGEQAYTMLAGATERDFKLHPIGIEQKSKTRKDEILADPANRRTTHVRVAKHTHK